VWRFADIQSTPSGHGIYQNKKDNFYFVFSIDRNGIFHALNSARSHEDALGSKGIFARIVTPDTS
jgi:hypothetical protein